MYELGTVFKWSSCSYPPWFNLVYVLGNSSKIHTGKKNLTFIFELSQGIHGNRDDDDDCGGGGGGDPAYQWI